MGVVSRSGLVILLGMASFLSSCRTETLKGGTNIAANDLVQYPQVVKEIFTTHRCTTCHIPGGSGNPNFSAISADASIANGTIVPGNANASKLYLRTANGDMPYDGNSQLSSTELATIEAWINSL